MKEGEMKEGSFELEFVSKIAEKFFKFRNLQFQSPQWRAVLCELQGRPGISMHLSREAPRVPTTAMAPNGNGSAQDMPERILARNHGPRDGRGDPARNAGKLEHEKRPTKAGPEFRCPSPAKSCGCRRRPWPLPAHRTPSARLALGLGKAACTARASTAAAPSTAPCHRTA